MAYVVKLTKMNGLSVTVNWGNVAYYNVHHVDRQKPVGSAIQFMHPDIRLVVIETPDEIDGLLQRIEFE